MTMAKPKWASVIIGFDDGSTASYMVNSPETALFEVEHEPPPRFGYASEPPHLIYNRPSAVTFRFAWPYGVLPPSLVDCKVRPPDKT